jgi:serine/threonine protein kinase
LSVDRVDRVGQVYGRQFRIDALIGKGAMADVYRALDLSTAAYVALKVLRQHLDDYDPAARQRFSREADVQAMLRHRNVAALLATGVTPNDEPFLVVELLRQVARRHQGRGPARAATSRELRIPGTQGLAAVRAAASCIAI